MPSKRRPLTVLVLAAGKGTRLRSKTIKLLHEVAGRPMVAWVLDTAASLKPARTLTVVGYQAEAVEAALAGSGCSFALTPCAARSAPSGWMQGQDRHLRPGGQHTD